MSTERFERFERFEPLSDEVPLSTTEFEDSRGCNVIGDVIGGAVVVLGTRHTCEGVCVRGRVCAREERGT